MNFFDQLALYPFVVINAPSVGQRVADFVNFLVTSGPVTYSSITITGHSEGAHIGNIK